MRGPAFFAYADNYLIDVKFGIIMDVKASRAIRQAEVGAAKTMIERTEERFDIKPTCLAADTAYGSADTLNWMVNEKKIAPHIPVIDKSKREDGTFSRKTSGSTKNRTYIYLSSGQSAHHHRPYRPRSRASLPGVAGLLPCLRAEAKMLSEYARAPDRARCERGCSRHCSCPGQDRGFRAITPHASCGLGGFGCAAHAVRKMSLPSPQSPRTYAGLRS